MRQREPMVSEIIKRRIKKKFKPNSLIMGESRRGKIKGYLAWGNPI